MMTKLSLKRQPIRKYRKEKKKKKKKKQLLVLFAPAASGFKFWRDIRIHARSRFLLVTDSTMQFI